MDSSAHFSSHFLLAINVTASAPHVHRGRHISSSSRHQAILFPQVSSVIAMPYPSLNVTFMVSVLQDITKKMLGLLTTRTGRGPNHSPNASLADISQQVMWYSPLLAINMFYCHQLIKKLLSVNGLTE